MGGPTPCQEVVDAVLVPEDGVRKKILDIGMYFLSSLFLREHEAHQTLKYQAVDQVSGKSDLEPPILEPPNV